jgi:hypothetical protein
VVRLDRWARGGRSGRRRLAEPARVALVACCWAPALLAQPTLRQGCQQLSPEDSARVEARLLPSLLARDSVDVDVSITCDDGIAVVSASVGSAETRRTVALSGKVGPEAILALAELAVAQLLSPAETEPTAATSAPDDTSPEEPSTTNAGNAQPATPLDAPSASEAARPPQDTAAVRVQAPVACAVRARRDSRVRADVALQSWGSRAAAGAVLGLEQAVGWWTYAFLAGAARPIHQSSLSDVTEWTAAAELGWQARDTLGVRISARLGLSLLTVNPDSGVVTSSGILKSAGVLELDFSRPIWLGRFGLAPGLGVRAFSAPRVVTIEGQPELQLSTPSAHVFLSMLFRSSE